MDKILGMLIVGLAMTGLTACNRGNVKPDLPNAAGAVAPAVIYVDRWRYVSIPDALTRPMSIPEGPIAQCFEVAAGRKAQQIKGNARLSEISKIQGTEVEP